MNPIKLIVLAIVALTGCVSDISQLPRLQDPLTRSYHVEQAYFAGGAGVTLAGELTQPASDGPHKAIVLISGSGPQDRNETTAGHRPFLVLSDHLTRSGYAVLRYDDRGVGESEGDYETADLHDFAADAAGAFRWLAARPDIDPSSIGLLGHSEGGLIAPVTAQDVDVAFMIFLASPARRLFPDVLVTQSVDLARANGASPQEIAQEDEQVRAISGFLSQPTSLSQIRIDFDAYLIGQGLKAGDRQTTLDQFATRWGVSHARHEPSVPLKNFDGPVLALFGGTDLQVSAEKEQPVMASILRHPKSETVVFEGHNHLFQPSQTGLPSEYPWIETTIARPVLNRVSTWLGNL